MPDLRYGTVSGFAAAAAEANRRRASSARATALAVAVVVTLGGSAGLTGRHRATDRIVPATPSPSVSATPGRLPRPVALPSGRAKPGAGPAVVPSRGPDAVSGVFVPSPSSRPVATVRPRQPWSTPIVRREYDARFPCLDVTKACFGTGAPVVTDDRVGLLAWYCTSAREGEELSFADDVEVEVWVERAGSDVPYWRSLTDRPARPGAHLVPLGSSRCLEWKTWWFRRGDGGSAAPSGSYDVWVRARSPQVTSEAQLATFYVP